MRTNRTRAILLAALCLAVPACQSRSDAERQAAAHGRTIADKWCSECHRVAPDQPSGARAGHVLPPPIIAPSFMAIAARPQTDRYGLDRFMTKLHLPMPTYRLAPLEQDNVIAYILSLKSDHPN